MIPVWYMEKHILTSSGYCLARRRIAYFKTWVNCSAIRMICVLSNHSEFLWDDQKTDYNLLWELHSLGQFHLMHLWMTYSYLPEFIDGRGSHGIVSRTCNLHSQWTVNLVQWILYVNLYTNASAIWTGNSNGVDIGTWTNSADKSEVISIDSLQGLNLILLQSEYSMYHVTGDEKMAENLNTPIILHDLFNITFPIISYFVYMNMWLSI